MLPRLKLLSYGQFGLVMAFVGLPIYVHAPKFYAEVLGLPLSLLGVLLFLPRLVDAVQDPYIGRYCDALAGRGTSRLKVMLLACPLLALTFLGLFAPPFSGITALSIWMVALLILVYTAFSFVTINLQAFAVEWSNDPHQRTRITAWREGFVLLGLLIASALPQILQEGLPAKQAFFYYALIFCGLLFFSALVLWKGLRREKMATQEAAPFDGSVWRQTLSHGPFRRLFLIGLLNATAASIPAALVLFFIEDVVQAPAHMGFFLAVYFLSGALGMPLWLLLSKRFGKKNAWLFAMLLSVAVFGWAFLLNAGDIAPYYAICVLAGLCLGADYALPPALIADAISERSSESGAFMGMWVFNGKLALAFSSLLALPLLEWGGYVATAETQSPQALLALSAIYALLPCTFKLIAAYMLWRKT